MKRSIRNQLFFLALASCLIFTALPASAADTTYIKFGGGGAGSMWFFQVGGLAPIWTRQIEGLNVVSQATAGDLVNVRKVGKGELDTAMAHSPTIVAGYNGEDVFKEAYKNIRLMNGVYESAVSIVVLEDSGIKSISDMAGKRVAVGPPGGGSARNSQKLFTALGMWDKIKPRFIAWKDAATALKEGNVDVFFQNGAPHPAVVSVEATHKIRLIGLTKEEGEIFCKKWTGYHMACMPPGTYETIDYPVWIFWDWTMDIVNADVEAKWVYDMLKVSFAEKEKGTLKNIHVLLDQWSPALKVGRGLGVPYHPGAIKYYKEKGLW